MPKTLKEIIADLQVWDKLQEMEICLLTQAQMMAYTVGDEDEYDEEVIKFYYRELVKAFRAGQIAALDKFGIQTRLELEETT